MIARARITPMSKIPDPIVMSDTAITSGLTINKSFKNNTSIKCPCNGCVRESGSSQLGSILIYGLLRCAQVYSGVPKYT